MHLDRAENGETRNTVGAPAPVMPPPQGITDASGRVELRAQSQPIIEHEFDAGDDESWEAAEKLRLADSQLAHAGHQEERRVEPFRYRVNLTQTWEPPEIPAELDWGPAQE